MGVQEGPLDDADDEDGEEEPPEAVGELGADVGLLVWAITHSLVIVFTKWKGRGVRERDLTLLTASKEDPESLFPICDFLASSMLSECSS